MQTQVEQSKGTTDHLMPLGYLLFHPNKPGVLQQLPVQVLNMKKKQVAKRHQMVSGSLALPCPALPCCFFLLFFILVI